MRDFLALIYFFGCLGPGCGVWDLSLQCPASLAGVQELRCSKVCGILVPQPGIEIASSALQGGFLTTGLPEKSQS